MRLSPRSIHTRPSRTFMVTVLPDPFGPTGADQSARGVDPGVDMEEDGAAKALPPDPVISEVMVWAKTAAAGPLA